MFETLNRILGFLLSVMLALAGLVTQTGVNRMEEKTSADSPALLAEASYPEGFPAPFTPLPEDGGDPEAWWAAVEARDGAEIPERERVDAFTRDTARLLLTEGDRPNPLCSPMNLWLCVNMLTHLTAGETRGQLMRLLGTDSEAAQAEQLRAAFLSMYRYDDLGVCVPSAALWLNGDCEITGEALSRLPLEDHASVHRGRMGDPAYDAALQAWLNSRTGGLLRRSVQDLRFAPGAEMSVSATLYFRSGWAQPFQAEETAPGVFHAADGDRETDFMHASRWTAVYEGEGFSAVILDLRDGSRAFFLLPEPGLAPEDLLAGEEAFRFLAAGRDWDRGREGQVRLTMPKLDCLASLPLRDCLERLGVTDVFSPALADFSDALSAPGPVSVSSLDQYARLTMDEQGIEAAAITISDTLGFLMPAEEEMSFTLDRPFLYALQTEKNLPLFLGVCHTP